MNKIFSPRGITCIIAAFIVILGLVLGAFFDLDITKALALTETDGTLALANHPISRIIFAVLGYFTSPVICAISAAVIVLNLLRKKGKLTVLEKLICIAMFLVTIGLMAYFSYKAMKTISITSFGFWHYLMMALMLFVLTFIVWFIAINLNPAVVKKAYIPAWFSVVTIGAATLFNEIAKFIWGRIRPRDLVELGSLDKFVNWYQVSGHTGYDSFPSGHSAQAVLLLLVIIWMNEFGAGKKAKRFTTIGLVVWIALMMFSRILAGAHFLSDVTAGFAVGFVFVYIAFVMYERKIGKPIY